MQLGESEASVTLYDKGADAMALEPHYCRHVMAMTAEELHSKSDIAVELARRDKRIDELERENAELQSALREHEHGRGCFALIEGMRAEERRKDAKLTRLQAVAKAAQSAEYGGRGGRTVRRDLLVALAKLLPDDMKAVK